MEGPFNTSDSNSSCSVTMRKLIPPSIQPRQPRGLRAQGLGCGSLRVRGVCCGFRVRGVGSRLGCGLRARGEGSGFEVWVEGSGFGVWSEGFTAPTDTSGAAPLPVLACFGFRIYGSGFRDEVLRFRVRDSGFRV